MTKSPQTRLRMLPMSIGDRIRDARTKAGLTQRELARGIGVSHGLIAHWENEFRNPSVDTVLRIAELTMTEPAWLLIDEKRGNYQQKQLLPDEATLLETFRRMSQRQRQNLLKLLRIAVDIRSEIETDRQPAHP